MQFTDLYDKILQQQKIEIGDTNSGDCLYKGETSLLPHSIFARIELAYIERIYTLQEDDGKTYLVVEVFVE